jgi:hypothetical protein
MIPAPNLSSEVQLQLINNNLLKTVEDAEAFSVWALGRPELGKLPRRRKGVLCTVG